MAKPSASMPKRWPSIRPSTRRRLSRAKSFSYRAARAALARRSPGCLPGSARMWSSPDATRISSMPLSRPWQRSGLKASCAVLDIREPEAVAAIFRSSVVGTRPPGYSDQQRRRSVSAARDRLFAERLERDHQHQSERHLVHDAGCGAPLAGREEAGQHRQYRRRHDARTLRRRPYHRRALGRHRAEPLGGGRVGAARHSHQLRRARRDRDRGLEGLHEPKRAPPIRVPIR